MFIGATVALGVVGVVSEIAERAPQSPWVVVEVLFKASIAARFHAHLREEVDQTFPTVQASGYDPQVKLARDRGKPVGGRIREYIGKTIPCQDVADRSLRNILGINDRFGRAPAVPCLAGVSAGRRIGPREDPIIVFGMCRANTGIVLTAPDVGFELQRISLKVAVQRLGISREDR